MPGTMIQAMQEQKVRHVTARCELEAVAPAVCVHDEVDKQVLRLSYA